MADIPLCCFLTCDKPAEWTIWDGKYPSYDNYTLSCTDPVGEMLTDAPEHTIWPGTPQ